MAPCGGHVEWDRAAPLRRRHREGERRFEHDAHDVDGPWSVGGQNCDCPSNAFRGAIDEVALYDKALDPERIVAHVRAAGR